MRHIIFAVLIGAGLLQADAVGHADTIGGTTWDRQLTGLQPRTISADSVLGVVAGWNFSALPGGGNPDLNVRFNYYDRQQGWRWIDTTGFMNSGIAVFPTRSRLGNMALSRLSRRVYLAANGTDGRPVLASESLPALRGFRLAAGPENYLSPLIAAGATERVHSVIRDLTLGTTFYYSGVDSARNWSEPILIPPPLPEPGPVTYVIAAAERSPRVAALWLERNRLPPRLQLAISLDDGRTWPIAETIGLPPAFHPRSETLPNPVDVFPWYDPDEEDALHIVMSVVPLLRDTVITSLSEIWHWRAANGWHRIVRAGCAPEQLQAGIGEDAVYAGRPTLGFDAARQELVCVWEQFDSLNLEPATGLLRADIWAARGNSAGDRWGTPVRLTEPDETSKRFPCVADRAVNDTIPVSYLVDIKAGFAEAGQGPWTNNPIVVRWVPVTALPFSAVAEAHCRHPGAECLKLVPNPCTGCLLIQVLAGSAGIIRIMDISGRIIRSIPVSPVANEVLWDCRDDRRQLVPAGVYSVLIVDRSGRIGQRPLRLLSPGATQKSK